MMRLGLLGLGFIVGMGLSVEARSADVLPALDAALNAREQVIHQLTSENLRDPAQEVLNTVVRAGIRALRQEGRDRMAQRYETEWENRFASYLTSPRVMDLGDHRPLSAWLAGFYDKLEETLGTAMIHQGILGDLYNLNYALPVVFAPKGDWRTKAPQGREWVEYRKHFIPFANIVTYWGVKIGCTVMLKKQDPNADTKVCDEASTQLRQMMGRHIAPKISDWIYKRANGTSASLEISESDLVYMSSKDLARALGVGGVQ